jgi:hypothetical protein
MLSLAFTTILVALAVMKVTLLKKTKEIILLINGLILFENKVFGEIFTTNSVTENEFKTEVKLTF